MTVEQQINKIEDEVKAIKQSFEQNASEMNIYTSSTDFQTQACKLRITNDEPYSVLEWDAILALPLDINGFRYCNEEVIVTFSCPSGSNTFASLELYIEDLKTFYFPSIVRLPYSGGARWKISVPPGTDWDPDHPGYEIWKPSILHIAVQSAAPGTLGVKMIWE